MEKKPLVSIIILNYNDREFIGDCLESVFNNDYGNIEVTLVDTGSTDDDYSKLERNYPYLKILKLKERTGFAKANNIGIKASRGDYFFLLNNDTIMKRDCLTLLVDAFQREPGLKLAGALGPPLALAGTDFTVPWDEELIYSHMISGFAMMIKKDCIKKIGYLEETFFFYGEDEEYGWRCNLAGYKVAYVRGAIVFHHRGGGKSQFNFQKLRNGIYWHIKLLDGIDLVKALFCDVTFQTIGRTIRWPKDILEVGGAWIWIGKHLKDIVRERHEFNAIKQFNSRHVFKLQQSCSLYLNAFNKSVKSYLKTT